MRTTQWMRAAWRLLVALGSALALVVGALVFAPAAYAGTDDYPSKWKSIPRDSTFDTWGEYNRECTSWVAWRLHGHNGFEMPFHANANKWGEHAKGLGYTVNTTPAVGSVAWWDTSTRSHVAWVEAVNPDKTITIEEYNIGGKGKYDQATIAATDPTGYIHFKDLATSFADGAYITYDKNVYIMAGGAPLYVTTWAKFGKKPSGLVKASQWKTLNRYPSNGTVVTAQPSGKTYRIVGGAPIFISSPAAVGATTAGATISDTDIADAGATSGVHSHLANHPLGTTSVVAEPSGTEYQIAGGAAVASTDTSGTPPTLQIGDDDIAKAGAKSSSDYSHLRGTIVAPAPTITHQAGSGTHPLEAHHTGWSPTGLTFTYRWLRDGVAISGATHHYYYLTSKDASAVITVRITATRSNFATANATSAPYAR